MPGKYDALTIFKASNIADDLSAPCLFNPGFVTSYK
jgi:hypothetical protein